MVKFRAEMLKRVCVCVCLNICLCKPLGVLKAFKQFKQLLLRGQFA